MSESFNLEIISPDQTVLKAEIEKVIIPAFEGMMTILKNHISLITFLRPGFLEVETKSGTEKFFVEEGTVEFSNNTLLILSSTIINKKNFTSNQISEMLEKTKKEISGDNISDKIRYILAHKISTLQEIKQ